MKPSLFKRLFFSKLFHTAGIIILILLAAAIAGAYIQKNKVNVEVDSLQREISRLEQGNNELGSLLEYLQTANFLETEARNKFGLAKEGEKAIVVVPPDNIESSQINDHEQQITTLSDLSNPALWWYYFSMLKNK